MGANADHQAYLQFRREPELLEVLESILAEFPNKTYTNSPEA